MYTLYGTPFSMFTGKAKACFAIKQVAVQQKLATARVFKRIIVPQTKGYLIPVVKTPTDEYLQDTTDIVAHLERNHPEHPLIPSTPCRKLVSYLFELWADEWLVMPAMHYRWNKRDNYPYVYEEFGHTAFPLLPAFLRRMAGRKLAQRFKSYVPLLGVSGNMEPALEQWFEGHILPLLEAHFANHDFVLGATPSIADASLMGPLGAHLFRDPAPRHMLKRDAPSVCRFIERLQNELSGCPSGGSDDSIPPTLQPLLKDMFNEQWPVLLNTVVDIEEWSYAYPDERRLPRSIGQHTFSLGSHQRKRAVFSFAQWKLQRVLDLYQSFEGAEKQLVDELLKRVNGWDAMQFQIKKPLRRHLNKVEFV